MFPQLGGVCSVLSRGRCPVERTPFEWFSMKRSCQAQKAFASLELETLSKSICSESSVSLLIPDRALLGLDVVAAVAGAVLGPELQLLVSKSP